MNKRLTADELHSHDGQDGRPAYIVYQGQVYDVSESKLWHKGVHMRRHHAGKDLTADLAGAPHDGSVFERVAMVGTLTPTKPKQTHPLLDFYLDQHPHPPSVHFPIALTLASAAFVILYLLTGDQRLADSAYYVLIASTITSPLAILTGASSWWFNYGRKLTPTFKAKIGLASTLFILQVITLTLWTMNPDALADRKGLGWLYVLLVIVMSGLVFGLGRLGGKIAFPPRKQG
jgi:predicted heme/steroid binding protein/uncharacterized membrane protein